MDDELQEVRDNFYIGNFQKAVDLGNAVSPTNDMSLAERDAIAARCALSLGQYDRLKVMQNSDNPGQKATALMAVIMKTSKEAQRDAAKEQLIQRAKETQDLSCSALAAICLAMDGSYNDATIMAKAHPTLEMQALCVFLCLICHQTSMAEKMLQAMSGTNDDSAAYRLAAAAIKLATGDPEEAYLTYCDLAAQFPECEDQDSSGSILLLTGKAVANMQRGMWTEAVEDLQKAHGLAEERRLVDVDVLVNLCCCMTHLNRKAEFAQYYAKLQQACPSHPYVAKTESISTVFATFKKSLEV